VAPALAEAAERAWRRGGAPPRTPLIRPAPSERGEKGEQRRLIGGRCPREAFARPPCLAVVGADRVLHGRRPPIVQVGRHRRQAPERRGPELAALRVPIPSPRLPMSWRRKSEYGWNVTWFRLATVESPVRKVSQWQWVQPTKVKANRPARIWAVSCFLGDGASRVMKSAKATTPEPSSLLAGRPRAGNPALDRSTRLQRLRAHGSRTGVSSPRPSMPAQSFAPHAPSVARPRGDSPPRAG
jgi:hypothetical protein